MSSDRQVEVRILSHGCTLPALNYSMPCGSSASANIMIKADADLRVHTLSKTSIDCNHSEFQPFLVASSAGKLSKD